MPKLYEYFGLIILFYSSEHEPIHVHGLCDGRECRAELIVRNGEVVRIRYLSVKGRLPLTPRTMARFKKAVSHFRQEIVSKWIEYFVLHKHVESERITRRLS